VILGNIRITVRNSTLDLSTLISVACTHFFSSYTSLYRIRCSLSIKSIQLNTLQDATSPVVTAFGVATEGDKTAHYRLKC